MLSAVVVVTFSLLVGGAFLLLVLQSSLISATWSNLAVRATDVGRLLNEEGVRETQSRCCVEHSGAARRSDFGAEAGARQDGEGAVATRARARRRR